MRLDHSRTSRSLPWRNALNILTVTRWNAMLKHFFQNFSLVPSTIWMENLSLQLLSAGVTDNFSHQRLHINENYRDEMVFVDGINNRDVSIKLKKKHFLVVFFLRVLFELKTWVANLTIIRYYHEPLFKRKCLLKEREQKSVFIFLSFSESLLMAPTYFHRSYFVSGFAKLLFDP